MANVNKGKGRPAKKSLPKAAKKSSTDKLSTLHVQTQRGKSVRNAKTQNTRGSSNANPAANESDPKFVQADIKKAEQEVMDMAAGCNVAPPRPSRMDFINQTMTQLNQFTPGQRTELICTLAGITKGELEQAATKHRKDAQEMLDYSARMSNALRNILNQ